MVRVIVDQVLTGGKHYIEAAGLHTDSKPTANVVTGSLYLEVDTGDVYAFAEGDSPTWYQITALGGDS